MVHWTRQVWCPIQPRARVKGQALVEFIVEFTILNRTLTLENGKAIIPQNSRPSIVTQSLQVDGLAS